MQTMDEILQTLRRLEPDQRERVRAELDALEQDAERAAEDSGLDGGYDKLLDLAGFATSDHTDLSSNKAKYVADSFRTKS